MIYYFPRPTGKSFQLPSQLINSISYYTNFLTWETPGTQGGQTENCIELPPAAQNLCERDHFTQMSSTLPQIVHDSIERVRRHRVYLEKRATRFCHMPKDDGIFTGLLRSGARLGKLWKPGVEGGRPMGSPLLRPGRWIGRLYLVILLWSEACMRVLVEDWPQACAEKTPPFCKAVLLTLRQHQSRLELLLWLTWLDPSSRTSDSMVLGRGLRTGISNKFPGDAVAAILGTTLWEQLSTASFWQSFPVGTMLPCSWVWNDSQSQLCFTLFKNPRDKFLPNSLATTLPEATWLLICICSHWEWSPLPPARGGDSLASTWVVSPFNIQQRPMKPSSLGHGTSCPCQQPPVSISELTHMFAHFYSLAPSYHFSHAPYLLTIDNVSITGLIIPSYGCENEIGKEIHLKD